MVAAAHIKRWRKESATSFILKGMSSADIMLPALLSGLALLGWLLGWRLCLCGLRLRDRFARHPPQMPRWLDTVAMRADPAARWPRGWSFLARRASPHRFEGLPLSLMIAAALCLLFLMAGLVEAVLEAGEMRTLDQFVNAWLANYHTPALVAAFRWITGLGGTETLTAVSLVATGFLWADHRGRYIVPLWVAIAGSQTMTWLGKYAFARPRPEFVTAAEVHSPSFPSAHAAGAMVVYGFIAYALTRDMRQALQRFHLAYWLAVVVTLVGFSRVFLNVHYVSDVALGFMLGIFWLLVGAAIHEYGRARARRQFGASKP